MTDGYAFKRAMSEDRHKDEAIEPAWTRWPAESVQVVLRTEDGQPPQGSDAPGVGEWERVWRLADVENLYDLGFWDNLTDVFVSWPVNGFREYGAAVQGTRSRPSSATETSALVSQE